MNYYANPITHPCFRQKKGPWLLRRDCADRLLQGSEMIGIKKNGQLMLLSYLSYLAMSAVF